MSNFFSDIQIQLGQIRNNAFGVFDYQTEFGDLSAKVTLTRSAGHGYTVPDKQIIDHKIYFEYEKDDGTWDTFNNFDPDSSTVRYTIAPWQVGSLGGGSSKSFTHNYLDSRIELGKYLGVFRKSGTNLRAKVRTRSKPLNYKQSDFNFANASLGSVPIGWSGTGLKRVSNGSNGAMALHGSLLTAAATDEPFMNSGRFRVANIDKTYGAFRDLQVEFTVMVPNSNTTYSDGVNTMTNGPESNQSENLYVQYKLGNGNWLTGMIITPNLLTPNVLTSQKFKIHQYAENLETVQIRFISRTVNTASDDVYIIDSVKVYSTTENAADQTGGNVNWDDSYLYSNESTAPALWAWDTSYTDIYWENDNSTLPTWAAENTDTDPYFELYNGEIRQARVVLGAKGISHQWNNSGTGIAGGVINFFEIARAAKFRIRIQNWSPSGFPPVVGAKSKNVVVDQGFFLATNYTGSTYADGNWKQQSQQQRVELDLSSVFNVSDFWETQQLWAIVEAYGIASNGEHYLVDSYNFSSSYKPHDFIIRDDTEPWDYVTFDAPGNDTSFIGINDIRIKTNNSSHSAYDFFAGVWSGTWVNQKSGNQLVSSQTILDGFGDDGYLRTGSQLVKSGTMWLEPLNGSYNFYGEAGSKGTRDTGLRVYLHAHKANKTQYSTGDLIDSRIVSVIPTLRRGWQFLDGNDAENAIQFASLGGVYLSHDNVSTWSLSKIVINAKHNDARAHWFEVSTAYSTDGGDSYAQGASKTYTGNSSTLGANTDLGVGFKYTLNNPLSDADLNSYFPSIYDNENYILSISVSAKNNLGETIDYVTKELDVSALGKEAADLISTSFITFGTHASSRDTKHAPYLYPTYRIAATDGTTYTGKAAYVRLDVFNENNQSLGNFFNTGFQNNQTNTKTSGWIKATNFGNYQTKVANNTATDYIRLSNGLHNSSFVNKTFKFIFRILADDGSFIDSYTENKTWTAFSVPTINSITPTSNYSDTDDVKIVVNVGAGTRFDYLVFTFKNTDTNAEVVYTSRRNGNGHYYKSSAGSFTFTQDENSNTLSIGSILNNDGFSATPIEVKTQFYVEGYDYNGPASPLTQNISTFTHPGFGYEFQNVTLSTDKNTHSEYDLRFQWSATDADFDKAGRFRIRLVDNSAIIYDNTSADLRKEFFVAGSSGTTNTVTRTVDLSSAKLDIADMLNNSATSRYFPHTIGYLINAQRDNNGTYENIPWAFATGTFARQALDWHIDDASGKTAVTIHSDTFAETVLKIRVYRENTSDTVPTIRFNIEPHAYMSGTGTVPHEAWDYKYFTTSVLNTEGNTMYEDFYYTIPDTMDRTKISQFKYQIMGGTGTGDNFSGFDSIITRYLTSSSGWKPYWKFSGSTSLSLGTNTFTDKLVKVNIRGVYTSSTSWRTPSKFGLTFKKLNSTGTNIIHADSSERELLWASSSPNNNTDISYRIKSFYDGSTAARSRATEEHYFQVVIKSYDASNNVMQTMTRAIIMPADPVLATALSTSTGCMLAPDGKEHLMLRFLNSGPAPSFKVGGHNYNLNVKILDGTTVVNEDNITIDTLKIGSYWNFTMPTGADILDDIHDSGYYKLEVTPSYYLDYNSSEVITGETLVADNFAEKIHNVFPKAANLENIGHTFDGSDGKFVVSFGKRDDGVSTGYNNQHSGFSFEISALEIVTGALEFKNSTPNPPSPLPNKFAGGFSQSDIESGISWDAYYPREANYKSSITINVEEKYDNRQQTWAQVITGNATESLDVKNLNTSAPNFTEIATLSTKSFTKENVTMNDLANYPNTTVVPTNIVVTDIEGEYAAPNKRFTFDVPIDFSTYFTNAEPFFSFGLEVKYKDSNNNTHTSGPSYITSQGSILNVSQFNGLGAEKIVVMQESSVYKVRDFGQEGGQYYFDLVLNPDALDYSAQPHFNNTNRRTVEYTLLVYIRDEVEIYGQEDKILTEPVAYSDIGNWTKSVVKGNDETPDPDDWYADGTIKLWEPVFSNFNVQPQTNDKTKFDYSFGFDIDDIKKKPYAFSQMNPRWRGVVKTLGGAIIGTNFYSPGSYHYDGGQIGPDVYDFNMSSLDKVNFDPFEDITFTFTPYFGMYTKIKNSYLFGMVDTIPELDIQHTLNYRDLIIPSFDSLSVDHSLNEDTINDDNTQFTNKLVFFFNKDKLKDVIKVFSLSEEWVTMRRNILQDGQTFSDGEFLRIYPWGASVSRQSHDAETWKITYTDGGIDLTKYNGLNTDKPFVFEYELTPTFRYRASDTSSNTYVELPEKKISTFLIPDEFPYANNGVSGLASKSVHEDKHSIHLKWNHQYTESLDTFRSVDAKIFFDLYWYVDETDAQKTVKEELKPKRRKLERIVENQNIASNWNFIDTVEYVYPSSPVTDRNYEFSYLWKYDKLETDTKMIVAVITRIESDVFGVLSQNIGTVGNNSIEIGVVKTSDKARKSKLHNDSELKRTPNKIIKRKEEFNTSLEQLPISTTRKKAKPRGSDKPYSSST